MRISDWSSDVCSSDDDAVGRTALCRDRTGGLRGMGFGAAHRGPSLGRERGGPADRMPTGARVEEGTPGEVAVEPFDFAEKTGSGRSIRGPRSEEQTSELQSLMRNS